MKIYDCGKCGGVAILLTESCEPAECLKPMTANTVDAAVEKHVPAVTKEGNTVKVSVGAVPHPMTDEHYIDWIMLVQGGDIQIKKLTPSDAPAATFTLNGSGAAEVYEHCTLHGLWKTEVK